MQQKFDIVQLGLRPIVYTIICNYCGVAKEAWGKIPLCAVLGDAITYFSVS